MSPALALAGWVLAVGAAGAALGVRLLLGSRMEDVARACHELRGPLTAARLGLEWGLRVGGLPPARLRAIELELGRATLALADLGTADRGVGLSGIDRFDVRGLLEDSVEAWRAVAASRGVELAVVWSGGPARVLGDRLRLAQATGNLIANAIEHGRGDIQVRGCADRSVVRIEVADSGPGLRAPLAELARDARGRRRFWRARDRARGHGLAIAAAVAAAHGGLLVCAPSERGARLVLELPLVGEHAAASSI
jgi:signal transduction histidine kinase